MKRTKEKASKGKKIVIGLAALVLLAIAGYFAFAYTTDYLRYRAIESYDQQLDDMAKELGAEYGFETIRREKYCYDDIQKLSHNLRCQSAIFIDGMSGAEVDMSQLSRGSGVACHNVAGLGTGTTRIYCGATMREWTPYGVYEDITDLYR